MATTKCVLQSSQSKQGGHQRLLNAMQIKFHWLGRRRYLRRADSVNHRGAGGDASGPDAPRATVNFIVVCRVSSRRLTPTCDAHTHAAAAVVWQLPVNFAASDAAAACIWVTPCSASNGFSVHAVCRLRSNRPTSGARNSSQHTPHWCEWTIQL